MIPYGEAPQNNLTLIFPLMKLKNILPVAVALAFIASVSVKTSLTARTVRNNKVTQVKDHMIDRVIRKSASDFRYTTHLQPGNFTTITLQGLASVYYIQADGIPKVTLASNSYSHPERIIRIRTKNGNLYITRSERAVEAYSDSEYRKRHGSGDPDVAIFITAPDISTVVLGGVGSFFADSYTSRSRLTLTLTSVGSIGIGKINVESLETNISATGSVDIGQCTASSASLTVSGTGSIGISDLTATNLYASCPGVGSITVAGKCVNAQYTVSGVGNISAKDMNADKVKATVGGLGDIECRAIDSFDGDCLSRGKIIYYGSPKILRCNGDVRHAD